MRTMGRTVAHSGPLAAAPLGGSLPAPSPGSPGEGWGKGLRSRGGVSSLKTLTLTLSRRTGSGDRKGGRLHRPMATTLVALLLAIAGCVARDRSPFDGLSPAESRTLARHLAADHDRLVRDDLRSAFAIRPPANVLVLSGGDAHGAFGCGVLTGWRAATGTPRPTFDIVTGVSTGALMATFAFLGQPRDDALLRDVYLNTTDADVFRGPVGGPPDAVMNTAPLARLIARHVTADTLRRVAAAHLAGRRLYVATVELDTAALVAWPMSRLAADAVALDGRVDAVKLDRFRAILLAAASIPVVFPPVEIDGGLHVDAGLRAAVFLDPAMLGDGPARPAVWVIFNGHLGAPARAVDADVVDLGRRSLDVFTHALEVASVRQVAGVAAAHRPPCPVRWVSEPPAPDDAAEAGPLGPMFDGKQVNRRYRIGLTLGRSAAGWHAGSPTEADLAGGADAPTIGP